MANTFGNTATPTQAVTWFGINTSPYQIAAQFASFPGGQVQSVSIYLASYHSLGSPTNHIFGLWDSSGNLLAQSATFQPALGDGTCAGCSWYTKPLTTPPNVAAGATLYIGWWRDPAGGTEFGHQTTGDNYYGNANTTIGPETGLTTYTQATAGVYLTYVQGGLKVEQAGAFGKYKTKARVAGAWQWSPVKHYVSGTGWIRRA